MTIHDLILEKQKEQTGKPSQDIFALLLHEEKEEGPNNQGLLWAYIQEAHKTLGDMVRIIQEDILYRKIKRGETVDVKVTLTGKVFTIRTAENNATGLPAYDILTGIKMEKKGIILDAQQLREWCNGLVEID